MSTMTQAEYALTLVPVYSLMDAPGFVQLISKPEYQIVRYQDGSSLHIAPGKEPIAHKAVKMV